MDPRTTLPGPEADRSLGELMRDLSADSIHLVRQEAQLFRVETEKKIARVQREAVVLGAGAMLSLLGALALVAATILLLAEVMPPFLAALLVGATLVVAGTVAIARGKKQLSAEDATPRETARSIREDVRTVREAWR